MQKGFRIQKQLYGCHEPNLPSEPTETKQMTQILEFTTLHWLHLKEPWNPQGNKLSVWKASDAAKLAENRPH